MHFCRFALYAQLRQKKLVNNMSIFNRLHRSAREVLKMQQEIYHHQVQTYKNQRLRNVVSDVELQNGTTLFAHYCTECSIILACRTGRCTKTTGACLN